VLLLAFPGKLRHSGHDEPARWTRWSCRRWS